MGKDPESRDWKIDRYISKLKAAYPWERVPSYEEVGEIIDDRDNRNKHIIYPMAGEFWNQIEWAKARDVRKFIEENFPDAIKIEPFYKDSRLIKKVILPDGIEKIVAYVRKIDDAKCIDSNDAALMGNILKELDEPINQMSKIKPFH